MTPTARVGSIYRDTVSAEDPDNRSSDLKFSLAGGPAGITISTSGIITWTPVKSDVGIDTIVVKVSDGVGGEAFLRFTVTVSDTNHAPYFTVADSNLTDTMFVSVTYRDTLAVVDPDSDVVTIKLIDSLAGMALKGRVVVFTPASNQRGTHTVRAVASDTSGATDTLVWTFTVANRPPAFTSKAADMLATGCTGKEYRDTLHAKDPENDTLRFALVESPAGMKLTDSIITWTPVKRDVGIDTIVVKVSDGVGGEAFLRFIVTVSYTNHAPYFTVADSNLTDTIFVSVTYRDTLAVVDPDSDVVTIRLIDSLAGMALKGRVVVFTPASSQRGTHTVRAVASDTSGAADTLVWTFTVANRPPAFTSKATDMTASGFTGKEYRDTLHAKDPENDTLQFALVESPAGMKLTDSIITWTPVKSDVGIDTIVVKVLDGVGGEALLRFIVTVSYTNHAPYFTVADSNLTDTMFVNTTYRDTLAVVDPDSDVVTIRLIDALAGMALNGRVVVFTPASNQRGTHTVRAVASDTSGAADTLLWTFTVANRPPAFTSKAADMLATGCTGKEYSDTLHAMDPDNDTLRFALVEFPVGMKLTDSIITWTPGTTEKGVYNVTVSVSDGIAKATLSWTITVTQIPVITRDPVPVTVTAGQTFTLTVGAAGDSLKFKWQKDGGTISGATDSIYRVLQSATTHSGLYRCIVYNTMGADTSDTARVTVNPFVAPVVYVKSDAESGGDGSSWLKAFRSVQAGINKATRGDQVWVAAGVYLPDTAGKGRNAAFSMKDGVEIYGGFIGTETSLSQRNWETNRTVLSGDIGVAGDSTDNCYHVIYNPATLGVTSSAILDGFTVRGGNANGTSSSTYGAGMYNNGAWPVVRNCAFESNTSYQDGGAMHNTTGSKVRVENTVFRGNKSTSSYGGAVYCGSSNATFIACTFEANSASASYYGGALYATGSNITINQCSFINNQANNGGAVYISSSSSSSIRASSFTNNLGNNGGGGVYLSSCGGEIVGCTFQSNRTAGSSYYGGSIYLYSSNTLISTSTFYSNIAGTYGGAVYSSSGAPSLVNCTMSDNQANSNGGAVYLSSSKARVVNNILWSNYAGGKLNDIGLPSTPDSLFLLNNIMQVPVAASPKTIDSGTITNDPLLSGLADNGGEVLTCAIADNSPALDTGVYVYKDGNGRLCYNRDGGSSYYAVEDGSAYTPSETPARLNAPPTRAVSPGPKAAALTWGRMRRSEQGPAGHRIGINPDFEKDREARSFRLKPV